MTSWDWADVELPPCAHILLAGVPRAGRSAELVKAERATAAASVCSPTAMHRQASYPTGSRQPICAMSRSGYPRAYGEARNAQLAIQLHLIGVELQQLAPRST
jgi:hypothetical protein